MTDSRNDLKDPSVRDEHVFVDDELIAAAEAFLEIALPAGAKYEVGLRLQFWQARDRLKEAIAAMRESLSND